MTTSLQLPGLLGELARAGFGAEALVLASEWGGSKRYIPVEPVAGMPLVDLIGLDASRFLAKLYGTSMRDIPRAAGLEAKKREIIEHPGGTRAAAQALGVTERYVRMVRNGQSDERQGRLFG